MFKRKWFLMAPEGDEGGSNGGGGEGDSGGAPAGDPPAGDPPAGGKPAEGAKPDGGTPEGEAGDPKPADPKPGETKGYWPEDWVARASKGDEKAQKILARFASPEALAESYLAAQAKIRSGELKSALPKNAKPEELTAWRKENGIPEKPEDYDLKFESGLVIGEADKPIIDGFLKYAHEKNLAPDQVKGNIEWYYQEQKRQTDERLAKDDEESRTVTAELAEEWGGQFKRNINMVEGLLNSFPESVRDQLKGARLPDGTGLFNNKEFLRGMAALALEVNPSGTLAPAGGNQVETVESEIGKIEKVMRENRREYNKDEAMQARYRDLLVAREKLQKRAA